MEIHSKLASPQKTCLFAITTPEVFFVYSACEQGPSFSKMKDSVLRHRSFYRSSNVEETSSVLIE
jgi:hypothetical protein